MAANKKQPYKSYGVVFLISIVTLLIIGGVGVYVALNPLDRVKVTTSQLPSDTMFVSFVSESNGTLQNMDWYPKTELGIPFTMQPSKSVWSSLVSQEAPKIIGWNAHVKWRFGEKYGIVTRKRAGSWKVTWFLVEDVPLKGHGFILGNGEAYFDLNKGKTTDLPKEKLRILRLDEFPFYEE